MRHPASPQEPNSQYQQQSYPQQYQQAPPPPEKKKRRIFLWVFLAIQVLFIIWIISAVGADDTSCEGLSAEACEDVNDAATGIGVFLILVFWFMVDAFLGLIYGIYRLASKR